MLILHFSTVNTLSWFQNISSFQFPPFSHPHLVVFLFSIRRYMASIKGAWELRGEWNKLANRKTRETAYLALSKYAFAKWKHTE